MNTDIHALSGAYAVDALDDDERALFERHLAECPACQAEVDGLREAAGTLAELPAVEPPPDLRLRVLSDISTVRPLPPAIDRSTPRARRRRLSGSPRAGRGRWAGLAAAAAVAAVALGGVAWHPWTDSPSAPTLSALSRIEHAPDAQRFTTRGPGGATVTVYRSVSLDRAAVVAQGLQGAPHGMVYQLWLQDATGVMRPAGFLPAGSRTSATLRGAAATASGAGITVEPAGGSSAPTSSPVALVGFSS